MRAKTTPLTTNHRGPVCAPPMPVCEVLNSAKCEQPTLSRTAEHVAANLHDAHDVLAAIEAAAFGSGCAADSDGCRPPSPLGLDGLLADAAGLSAFLVERLRRIAERLGGN